MTAAVSRITEALVFTVSVLSSLIHAAAVQELREAGVHKLLQVFELGQPRQRERHYSPPQYMLDLYNAVADSAGLTLAASPYYANVIRSFPDKDLGHHLNFHFNVSSVPAKEKVLEAELHLFKLKPRPRLTAKKGEPRSHLLDVRVYQVTNKDARHKEEGNKLLATRRISSDSVGWEIFYIKDAVKDWVRDEKNNMGLLVTATTISGAPVEPGTVRFVKRQQHHVNKQPILVLFSQDGRRRNGTYYPTTAFHNYGYPELQDPSVMEHKMLKGKKNSRIVRKNRVLRRRRLSEKESFVQNQQERNSQSCTRHELYVDFEKIGWSTWIISPTGYNAYYCKGACTFPLGQNQWPTNHATVQSIVHELNLTPGVGTPCCVPNKLQSISLLYFDEHENVVLKHYDDMVAGSCGCH